MRGNQKLKLLAMMAVLRIPQMMLAQEEETEQPIAEAFDEEQQGCLSMVNKKSEGQTEKQSNLQPSMDHKSYRGIQDKYSWSETVIQLPNVKLIDRKSA